MLGKLDDPGKYLCVLNGFVRAAETGYYLFATQSRGALKVYLGKQLVIDLPDVGRVSSGSCIVPLSQGFYPIRVERFLKQPEQKFELYYAVPVGQGQGRIVVPIPWQEMYSAKAGRLD